MAASYRLSLVDAFADRPFTGNPAAVCLFESDWPNDVCLARFAAEMNQAETAFVLRRDGRWLLRWFTPKVEVDLCGHATLAAAHALWQWQLAPETQPISFETRSGSLRARATARGIELDFPPEPARELDSKPEGLLQALNLTPTHSEAEVIFLGRNRFDYLVVVSSVTELVKLKPNFHDLLAVECRGVIVTAENRGADSQPRQSTETHQIVSRFFAPRCGIDEDPVTGSAHCCLAVYWSRVLGRTEFLAYQASERGGSLNVRLAEERVFLTGGAHTVFDTTIATQLFV